MRGTNASKFDSSSRHTLSIPLHAILATFLESSPSVAAIMRLQIAVTALLALSVIVQAEHASALLISNLNSEQWLISNQNGSISFEADRLPLMVLEGLVKAGQVDDGDPIAG